VKEDLNFSILLKAMNLDWFSNSNGGFIELGLIGLEKWILFWKMNLIF